MNHAVKSELLQIREKLTAVGNVQVVTCVDVMVQIKIEKTAMKQIVICFQFPENYPNGSVLIELKSKTLSQKFLHGLSQLMEKEAVRMTGEYQVVHLVLFVKKFIEDHPLCACSEEISNIKAHLLGQQDEIKLKQKTSQVILKTKEKDYSATAKFTIPEDYPNVSTKVEITASNFPDLLCVNFTMQCVEIARQCVEAPIKPRSGQTSFLPRPSLFEMIEYLLNTTRRYPHEVCQLCGDLCLPENPKDVVNVVDSAKFVERLHCGDLFHHKCIDTYMKSPPFKGGKKCPACNERIFHEKWHISPELAEARWAHKEARSRELDEVVDFLE